MKRPDKISCISSWKQVGKVPGGRVLMERIVLVSREPQNREPLITLIQAVFPECRVEVISKTGGELSHTRASLEKEIGSYSKEITHRED
ncbi:MAG: hypothetical protein JRL30_28205 [Deltaproteobacteria bacterium]|nr:hypothetical protein [Deltaproteobacteria bacterium]